MAALDRVDRGETFEEDQASARKEMGNAGLIKEVTREIWGWAALERLLQDLRFGARMLRKNPGSTLVAMLTLALGIGASTAIFSVVYGVLLRPLDYEKPEQIVRVSEVNDKGGAKQLADPNFQDLREQNHVLQGLAEYASIPESISGGSQPQRLIGAHVSTGFPSCAQLAGNRAFARWGFLRAGAERYLGNRPAAQAAVWTGHHHERCGRGSAASRHDERHSQDAHDFAGRRWFPLVGRLCQCDESVAGAGLGAGGRTGSAHSAGRVTRTPGPAVSC